MSYFGKQSLSASALPSSKKGHSEKFKQILKQLLREEDNRRCADCKIANHPRWASWNLGCFVCIRCSGIHRSMGTHISRVKSVDLDSWTEEQIQMMVKWGNYRCNMYWEAKLPGDHIPDQLKINNFIKSKYEDKKWALSSKVPDPLLMNVDKQAKHGVKPAKTTSGSDLARGGHSSLIDDDFGVFTSSTHSHSKNSEPSQPRQTKMSPARTNSSDSSSPGQLTGNIEANSTNNSQNGRPDLKKSILSLYSSPSATSSAPNFMPSQNNSPALRSSRHSATTAASLSTVTDSLQGLRFDTNNNSKASLTSNSSRPLLSSNATAVPGNGAASKVPMTPWNSEWVDYGTRNANTTGERSSPSSLSIGHENLSALNLEDDLFKNVWN